MFLQRLYLWQAVSISVMHLPLQTAFANQNPVRAFRLRAFGALLLPAPFPAESKQRFLASAYGQRVVRVTSRAQEDPTNACSKQKLGLMVPWQLDSFSSCGCAEQNSIPAESALREENLS
jgi:hypothetical protein